MNIVIRTLCLAALVLAAALAGCSSPVDAVRGLAWLGKKDAGDADAMPRPSSVQVKVDTFGKPLREGQQTTISSEDFMARAQKLLSEERNMSLQKWVAKFPDVALEMLRTAKVPDGQRAVLAAVATYYDRQMGMSAADGWQATLSQRTRNPKSFASYDVTRALVLQKLRVGEAAETNLVKLVPTDSGAMQAIDAWQLQAKAYLVAEKMPEAAAAMQNALSLAEARDPYQAAQLLLLLSEAERRIEKREQADQTWLRAVDVARTLAERQPTIVDPQMWTDASYLRPIDKAWPQTLLVAFGHSAASQGTIVQVSTQGDLAAIEAAMWTAIGHAHLDRNENQAALLALKQAEACTRGEAEKDQLRLEEAQVLARLDQTAAATAMLIGLSGRTDPALSHAAMAVLGAQKLRSENSHAGYKLLSKALEEGETVDWPARAHAEADLGLAYLIRGEDAKGLRWLHSAQGRFATSGDVESLAKSLWNEAKYFEHKDKKKEAAAIWKRLRDIERAG
jgi:tetratricopeptide (TPR) repeat protein